MKKEDTAGKNQIDPVLFKELNDNLRSLFTRYAGIADRSYGGHSDNIQAAQAAAMLARELRKLHSECEPK